MFVINFIAGFLWTIIYTKLKYQVEFPYVPLVTG